MFLRRTRGSTHAVTPGAAADEEDEVAVCGRPTKHVLPRCRRHDRADFETLRHIARMIDLGDLSGGEADLISVGGVTPSRDPADFLLRQLARKSFGNRNRRIGGPGYPHGLVDVGSAGKGIANASAEAGGGTSERLDFGGVIVGFVFELNQPLLRPDGSVRL